MFKNIPNIIPAVIWMDGRETEQNEEDRPVGRLFYKFR